MTILCLGLIVSLWPTAYFGWALGGSFSRLFTFNARCFFDLSFGKAFSEKDSFSRQTARESTVVSIVLISLNLFTRTIKLMKPWADRFRKLSRGSIGRRWMASTKSSVVQLESGENSISCTRVSMYIIWPDSSYLSSHRAAGYGYSGGDSSHNARKLGGGR